MTITDKFPTLKYRNSVSRRGNPIACEGEPASIEDLRAIQSHLTPTELYEFADTFNDEELQTKARAEMREEQVNETKDNEQIEDTRSEQNDIAPETSTNALGGVTTM